ncbi:hypothetical protein LTR66_010670 [Elasticomyces elasticus]|nr:hypothetical protein LTR66_010670 [Elasticomyces elasticus]
MLGIGGGGADPLFALPLGEWEEEWTVRITREGLWERWATLSQVAAQEGEARERLRERFWEAVGEAEEDERGEIALHGRTVSVWTTKVPADGAQGAIGGSEM